MSFGIYADTALTTSMVLQRLQIANQAPASPLDGVCYIGSPNDTIRLQTEDNPGVDPIILEIGDSDPLAGASAANVKLALTSGGLDTAIGGDPLELPHTINGGTANAVTVHWRLMPQSLPLGVFSDTFLIIDDVLEYPI